MSGRARYRSCRSSGSASRSYRHGVSAHGCVLPSSRSHAHSSRRSAPWLMLRTRPVVLCGRWIIPFASSACSQHPPAFADVELNSAQPGFASHFAQHCSSDMFMNFSSVCPLILAPRCSCTLAGHLPAGDGDGPGGAGAGGGESLPLKLEDQLKNLPAAVAMSLYFPRRRAPRPGLAFVEFGAVTMCSTSVLGDGVPSTIAGSRLKPSISGSPPVSLAESGACKPAIAWRVGSQSDECARPTRWAPRRAGGSSGEETKALTRSPPS